MDSAYTMYSAYMWHTMYSVRTTYTTFPAYTVYTTFPAYTVYTDSSPIVDQVLLHTVTNYKHWTISVISAISHQSGSL